MIIGIGVDIVAVDRFTSALQRTPGLLDRLFVPAERGLNVSSLAARFAAKEAVAKALGAPLGLSWHDCWIGLDESGPTIQVNGSVEATAARLGVRRWHVSMSHDAGISTAFVIAEG